MNMKRYILIVSFVCVIIVGLLLVEITLSNQIATTGDQLLTIENKTDDLKNQNLIIQQQVLQASSLTTINQKATAMGFVQDTTPVYITTPLPLALNR
jgi:hypothetical protein